MGEYDSAKRALSLSGSIEDDPTLGLASLVDGVVQDLLHRLGFEVPLIPEVVDMAVIGTGLGALRNQVDLVAKTNSYWDSTQWNVAPRPFLDVQGLAYANALSAWTRGELAPKWISEMPGALRRKTQASSKYLNKTSDCFYVRAASMNLLTQSQDQWWKLVDSPSASTQINALRQLQPSGECSDAQAELLGSKLDDSNRAIVLHAVGATERLMQDASARDDLAQKLRVLADHRDDEISSKAMCALARLNLLDEICVEIATGMLESARRHVVFSGGYGLATLGSIPEETERTVDRAFRRSLRACDYEMVSLFASAYHRWFEDPISLVRSQLSEDPELLQVALDALDQQHPRGVKIA